MQLVLVQTDISPDKTVNLANALTAIAKAATRGAALVVFPEMYMALPVAEAPLATLAETLDGPFVTALATAARQHHLTIVCGVWEQSPVAGRVYNTLAILGPDGHLQGYYRKLHLFDALSVRESERMIPGTALPPVVDIGGIPTGFAICYDLRFPELFRDLAARGAELVLVPAAWYAGPCKEDHWLTLLRARAIENTLYVAGCNLTGKAFCGRSSIFDPFGVPLAGAGEDNQLLYADLERVRVQTVREKLPALQHRRRELY